MESEFFVLRTALLPFDALLAWSEGLEAPAALSGSGLAEAVEADRARLRARLAAWVGRPEVEEALFVASPSLHAALERWRRDPESRKGRRCERALVRYFIRMASRPTPFGLFAGSSLGEIGEKTRLELAGREGYGRRTRLDMDYVFALADDLARDPVLVRELVCRPNSSLYFAGGCWRLAEVDSSGRERRRKHRLVEFDPSDPLDEVIRRADGGARPAELAEALCELLGPEEVTFEEALEFVDELLESQVLVPDLAPPLTGPEPVEQLIRDLGPHAPAVAHRLGDVDAALRDLDEGGLGADPRRYLEIAGTLGGLGTATDLRRLFQVDLEKPVAAATLGREVVEEIHGAVELLHRLWSSETSGALERFRQAFVERYGEETRIPLMEVLDEEAGIGFGQAGAAREDAPLLAGLDFPGGPPATWSWRSRESWLLRRLEQAWDRRETVIRLTRRDLEALTPEEPPPPLPDALHVLGTLASTLATAEDSGPEDFKFLVNHASGPSGARLLGRFCHSDGPLRRRVEEHLRREEAWAGETVLAEIVHVPQGRMGNVLRRPRLREYEIPYLGRSVAPPEARIPVSDLLLTVSDDKIELYSARLGRLVIPRLTSAHNYEKESLALYRFLGYLQNQGLASGLFWSWGPFESAAFLPRVEHGRVVLTRARWRLGAEEIERLSKLRAADRFEAVRQWRKARRLPRRVVLVEDDNELLVDLDNVLALDSFLDGVRGRSEAVLVEVFPDENDLCVQGPEGVFAHEVLVPCVRSGEVPPVPEATAPRLPSGVRRSFPPGSEWLYAKLYVGRSSADRVLSEAVAPLVREVLSGGAADSWFFLRYGDPDWHVRLRFHGDPERLRREVLPRILDRVSPLVAEGRLARLAFDTYERELERYGGEGIVLVERLFAADSDAALRVLEAFAEDGDARWRAALLGIDRMLEDAGLELADKLRLTELIRNGTARVLKEGRTLRFQIDRKYRGERLLLEELLHPGVSDGLDPVRHAFAERSRVSVPLFEELGRWESAGRLASSVFGLVPSLVHMAVNRLVRSSAREHELVLYDFLHRHYRSAVARLRSGP